MELFEILIPLGALLLGSLLFRNCVDKSKGEPLLTEEALVHAKSDHVTRYTSFYLIHFYIAARDTRCNLRRPGARLASPEEGTAGVALPSGRNLLFL